MKELVTFLIEEFGEKDVNISLPSLRIDAFSLDVMSRVQDVKKSSLTFAPEAGSQRMRNVINKGLTEEDILSGAAEAFKGGWSKVKLYFMLGLPTETEEDIRASPPWQTRWRRSITIRFPRRTGRAGTGELQHLLLYPQALYALPVGLHVHQGGVSGKGPYGQRRQKAQLNHKSLKYNWHDADVSVLEGVLARGDRRVGAVLLDAYKRGCLFDSWSECFDNEKWMEAFKDQGVEIGFYNLRKRSLDEILPWDFIDAGITKEFFKERVEAGEKGAGHAKLPGAVPGLRGQEIRRRCML